MAKARTTFVCRSCGNVQSRWMGKCPDCGVWDTLEEHKVDRGIARDPQKGLAEGWAIPPAGFAALAGDETAADSPLDSPKAAPLDQIGDQGVDQLRIPTGIAEFDRVLGGGIVRGSAILVGGDPGIGKSTLMLQAAGKLAHQGVRTLYVASEESAQQVRLRAERLQINNSPAPLEGDGRVRGQTATHSPVDSFASPSSLRPSVASSLPLFILADTNLARIVEQARQVRPSVLVIDSIQMIYKADLDASPGTIAQLRRCCTELVYLAKISGMAVILVGHVTKDGSLAGPRLLEHMVDAVLYFEGDRYHAHRVIRAVKNRFGATLEIGLFEMTGEGLREADPSGWLGALNQDEGAKSKPTPGSVVCPVITGSRCFLVEVQALTTTGFLGAAKRKSSGVDASRLAMLIAVLEQHAGLRLADRDVFASAVGGVRIAEPAADLALALAIGGAHLKRGLAPRTAAVGEVGLGGEVRPVTQAEIRLREAARLGFKRMIVPARLETQAVKGVELVRVRTLQQAMEELA